MLQLDTHVQYIALRSMVYIWCQFVPSSFTFQTRASVVVLIQPHHLPNGCLQTVGLCPQRDYSLSSVAYINFVLLLLSVDDVDLDTHRLVLPTRLHTRIGEAASLPPSSGKDKPSAEMAIDEGG